MTSGCRVRAGLFFAVLAGLCGCGVKTAAPVGYFGPTQTIDQVIAGVNANNSQIKSLWAHVGYFEATAVDAKTGKTSFVNANQGTLLYQADDQLRLKCNKDVADLFDLGSNGKTFWFRQIPDPPTFWWGDLSQVHSASTEQIPVRPDLILDVLGVLSIDQNLTDDPAPVMRFNNDDDSYMIVWQTKLADRWVAQREIWYDRATLQPQRVLLFDENGRVVLRAKLEKFVPVAVDGEDRSKWPRTPTILLFFLPDRQTHIRIELQDVALQHNGFPKPVSFRMPDPAVLAGAGVKVINVDEDSNR